VIIARHLSLQSMKKKCKSYIPFENFIKENV
jgi:hypothetical protein